MGAIIPALMHRIPSELRSKACLGESSTRMGDHLGSPRVAPLFPVFEFLFSFCIFFCDFVAFISSKRHFSELFERSVKRCVRECGKLHRILSELPAEAWPEWMAFRFPSVSRIS